MRLGNMSLLKPVARSPLNEVLVLAERLETYGLAEKGHFRPGGKLLFTAGPELSLHAEGSNTPPPPPRARARANAVAHS